MFHLDFARVCVLGAWLGVYDRGGDRHDSVLIWSLCFVGEFNHMVIVCDRSLCRSFFLLLLLF